MLTTVHDSRQLLLGDFGVDHRECSWMRRTYSETDRMSSVSERLLTREEIDAFQRQLSLLSEPAVRDQYIQAHARCCLGRGAIPSPAEVQRFLSIWKVLWRWEVNK